MIVPACSFDVFFLFFFVSFLYVNLGAEGGNLLKFSMLNKLEASVLPKMTEHLKKTTLS